ncbi:MAG: beta-propeller fold lactonase family protein [Phycisphaeraceae bacterium]|nr:MAG: beta-propeller fold lactonase family protein [Phycisphaeraceae bacterium]
MPANRTAIPVGTLAAAITAAALTAHATAQADLPMIFVANEGNLEGSVTSMHVLPSGALQFADRVITGTRGSTSEPCPGCNPYAIDITPSGQFLATTHAAGDNFGENITVYEVAADGSLTVVEELELAQAGLDIVWLSNDLLAVPLTDLSTTNTVRLFHLDEDNQLTQVGAYPAGGFLTSMALHPSRRWLYTNDSLANTVRVFEVVGDTLTLVQTLGIPVYGTGIEVTPNGRFLYAAGGISAGGHAFAGYAINPADGTLSALPGSPFTSPGSSPKGFTVSTDSTILYVSHGTDATIRSFLLDNNGIPTSTGFMFDIGLQGTLREMDTLDGLLFALDDSTAIDGVAGAYSFNTFGDGSFTPLPGTPVDTQGVSPNDVVAWDAIAGCNAADIASPFNILDLADVQAFIQSFVAQTAPSDIAPPLGVWDLADVQAFISAFTAGCP